MLGFRFQETMTGQFHRPAGETGTFSFTGEARTRGGLLEFLRDGAVGLRGTVRMEGVAREAPIEGSLIIAPVTRGYIAYEFRFTGDDGAAYRFDGAKGIKLADLAGTMTTLHGTIYGPDGAEYAHATARFDLRGDLGRFLRSWRLVRGARGVPSA